VPPHRWALTADEAAAAAEVLGGAVALKLVSAGILHKSDVGGVRLGLEGASAARAAFDALRSVATEAGADFRGALVVAMAGPGVDVAVGLGRTDLGGHALLLAAGGTDIEALDDVAARPAPVDADDAGEMIGETAAGRLLERSRGPGPPSLAPLRDLMVRLSAAVAGSALVEAVDLNPVRVGPDGVLILDARVLLTPETSRGGEHPERARAGDSLDGAASG
jgi:hypothetical protein